jgi:hypothetical protein
MGTEMAFWSSQTLAARVAELTHPPVPKDAIDCNSITLRVGREIYVTPELEEAHIRTKQQLRNNQGFLIPPGQFAYLMTEEIVKVPNNAMAFISMKATFKMKGLVNVSGFLPIRAGPARLSLRCLMLALRRFICIRGYRFSSFGMPTWINPQRNRKFLLARTKYRLTESVI